MIPLTTDIPPGFWRDAAGRLVPEASIKEIDRLRDSTVREIVARASALNTALAQYKAFAFSAVDAFIALSIEQYGAKGGGAKGNVTLTTFDGRFRLVCQVQEYLVFDERLQAAKELVDECLSEWSQDSRPEIQALVSDAFQVGKEGRINLQRVLSLRRLRIDDAKWRRAMDAISDSLTVASTSRYVRVYERIGQTDQYRPIPLDLAAVAGG